MNRSAASSARNLFRSHGFTVADQAISSLGNFLLVIAVARVSDSDAFGAFSLAYLVYGLGLALFRAALGDVLLLRTRLQPEPDSGYRGFLAVAFALGLSLGALLALVAILLGGDVRAPMLALAVAMPVLLLQDAYRFVLISSRRSRRAAVVDGVWLTLQAALFAGSAALGTLQSGAGLTFLWAAAALCSIGVALGLTQLRPELAQLRPWVAAGQDRIRSLAMDYLVFSGTIYAGLYAVPVLASLATLAALRGAQVFFAPFEVLMNGIRLVALPALINALSRSRSAFRQRAAFVCAGFGLVAVTWGVIVVSLPHSIGEAALGDTWTSAEPLLPAFAIGYLALAVSTPAMDGVRGAGSTQMILTTRLCAGILQGGGILIGVAGGGTEGGAVGFAIGLWSGSVVWTTAASRLDTVAAAGPMREAPEQLLWDPEAGPN